MRGVLPRVLSFVYARLGRAAKVNIQKNQLRQLPKVRVSSSECFCDPSEVPSARTRKLHETRSYERIGNRKSHLTLQSNGL